VYRSAFAGVVREVALRYLDVTGDGGDVDDGAGVARVCLGGLLEERKEGGGHEEGADDVGLVDVEPFLLGCAVEELRDEVFGCAFHFGLAWGDAGVVDWGC